MTGHGSRHGSPALARPPGPAAKTADGRTQNDPSVHLHRPARRSLPACI